jgi:putative Holliday junction resolvase
MAPPSHSPALDGLAARGCSPDAKPPDGNSSSSRVVEQSTKAFSSEREDGSSGREDCGSSKLKVIMRTMGLDVGTKTIGVAVSDELGITGQSVTTLRRTSLRADLAALGELIAEHQVSRIVVGLPLNMDGTEGPMAKACREFGAALAESSGRPVEYWDERLSTVEAERALLEADVSRRKRRQVVDRLAAAIILQSWLDARSNAAGGSRDWETD